MKKRLVKLMAIISGVVGVGMMMAVMLPIISYEILGEGDYRSYLSPVPEGIDYTKASNWFSGGGEEFGPASKVSYYTISIPGLDIRDATVAIGGEDLSQYLIQYPGTALPGKRGNAVIFGHSILPQFYNPDDYLSIFSLLPSLKVGNEIVVNYDGVEYLYRVMDKFEVGPRDLEVLEQNMSDSFLSLVTCVPPGHPLRPRRLVVRAKVVPLSEAYGSNRS